MIEWVNEWMTEFLNEWMNGQLNNWGLNTIYFFSYKIEKDISITMSTNTLL